MIIQDNPFHKANPFKLTQYQKFQHPYLHSQKNNDHQHLIYHQQIRPHHNKILENNWTFNSDNLSKKLDFSRKQDLNSSTVSQFEMKMKMANIGVPHHRNNNVKVTQGKLQNPFYRKNLLFNKEDVMNQVQLDVTLYRNKAKSSYHTPTSNVPVTYSETPVLTKNRPSFSEYEKLKEVVVDSQYIPNESPSIYNSLNYSKTPKLTQRSSDRQISQQPQNVQQQNDPQRIFFKGKQFFLN